MSNFINIRRVDAELFRAGGRTDRQTDMTKLTVAFRNYANAPEQTNAVCEKSHCVVSAIPLLGSLYNKHTQFGFS